MRRTLLFLPCKNRVPCAVSRATVSFTSFCEVCNCAQNAAFCRRGNASGGKYCLAALVRRLGVDAAVRSLLLGVSQANIAVSIPFPRRFLRFRLRIQTGRVFWKGPFSVFLCLSRASAGLPRSRPSRGPGHAHGETPESDRVKGCSSTVGGRDSVSCPLVLRFPCDEPTENSGWLRNGNSSRRWRRR